MNTQTRRSLGFTLLEVLLALVIMSVMLAVAMPRIGAARTHLSVDGATQRLVSDLNRARMEAIKRNAAVTLRRESSTSYRIDGLPSRRLDSGVTFGTSVDSVRFGSVGNVVAGTGTLELGMSGYSRSVHVQASGFAHVQ